MSLLLQGLLRGGSALLIMGLIALALYFQNKKDQAKSTFLSAIIAFFVGMATVIYEYPSLSLLQQSIIHFLIMIITVYPTLLLSNWFPMKGRLKRASFVFLVFIGWGAVLYTIMFSLAKIFNG